MFNNSDIINNIYSLNIIPKKFESTSIYYGTLGRFFFNYFFSITSNNKCEEQAIKFINEAEKQIQKNNFHSSTLSLGLAGYIEGMNIVNSQSEIFDEKEYLCDVYKALTNSCVSLIKEGNFDFYTGCIGIIHVLENAYQRNPQYMLPFINKIVSSFENQKIDLPHFITNQKYKTKKQENDILQSPHYICGLAHGLSSVIMVFSKLIVITGNVYLKDLTYKLIDLILKYKNPEIKKTEPLYLERIYIDEKIVKNTYHPRLAWCYSDLTLGWAFLKTGMNLKDDNMLKIAQEVLHHTVIMDNALKLAESSNVICLCHGSAGNAYIYKKIYEETGNDIFFNSFKKWEKKAFDNYSKNQIYFNYDANMYVPNYTMMDGIIGYGLFLLSLENKECNSWNSLLLLN